MALQASGPIALFTDIRAEEIVKTPGLSSTDFGLREVSAAAAFTEPDLMSEFYGYSSVTPIVWTDIPSEISKNDTSINVRQSANTYDQGNGTITSKGFYYGTSTNINSATKVQVNTSNNTAEFTRNFTGLNGGTTYRFWAYAINDVGETVSGRRDISTLATIPVSTVNSWNGGIYANGNPWSSTSTQLNAWGNATSDSCYQHPYYGLTCPDSKSIGVSVLWKFAGNLNYTSTFNTRRANNTTTTNRRGLGFYAWAGGDLYGSGSATSWQPYHLRGNNTYISNMSSMSTYYNGNGCGNNFRDYGSGNGFNYNNDAGACIYHGSINYYDIDWYWSGGGSSGTINCCFGRVIQEFNSGSGIYFTQ